VSFKSGHAQAQPYTSTVSGTPAMMMRISIVPYLLSQEFLDLADFLFKMTGVLFIFAFGSQRGILDDFPHLLFDVARHQMEVAFCLAGRARFHGVPLVGLRVLTATPLKPSVPS
jgi:hypothetical protein